ncbi:ABC transporter family substrate-binding protein [Corynebacterium variabile]|uniref:ABC transporter family substrate-binding protein n=1 Tax=Corynebacterium variabile TaxID=1727 RepID=UPI003A8F30DB
MVENSRPRRLSAVMAALSAAGLVGAVLVGCQARPSDAPTVAAPQTASTTQEETEEPGTVPDELRTVTVGLDSIPGDLNPHLIGSRSLATSVVAQLTLPSAFTVPAGSATGARTELNTDLLESVKVTEGTGVAPTKVRYVLRPDAQWSDGTPVTGADFDYLHQQITGRSGVVDPAGYAMIDKLSVSAGGRTVDVTFTGPDPDWRELFANLLPSHIYRTEDRSFDSMMSGVPAASGGIFRVRGVDTARGEIRLDRNQRYWGETPARTDSIVLSAVPDSRTATQMLRTGQLQMLLTGEQGVTTESLAAVPGLRVREMTRRPDLVMTLNTTAPRMASLTNRTRVTDALDADALARILTQDPSATAPGAGVAADDGGETGSTGSGTGRDGSPATPALPTVSGDLTPLRIGADSGDATAVEAARRVVDQLTGAGIAAEPVIRSSADLYGSFLPAGEVDAVIAWQETPETLSELRSRYGCDTTDRSVSRPSTGLPSVTATPTSESRSTETTKSTESTAPMEPMETTESGEPTESATEGEDAAASGRTVNTSGLCSAEIDGIIDAALLSVEGVSEDGVSSLVDAAVERVSDAVAEQRIDVPLTEDRRVIAAGPDLVGPEPRLADWPLDRDTGPLASAAIWRRAEETSASSSSAAPTTSTTTDEEDD